MLDWWILQLITATLLLTNIVCLVIGHWSSDYVMEVPSSHASLNNAEEILSVQEARLTFQTVPTMFLVTFPIAFANLLVMQFAVRQVCQSDIRLSEVSGAQVPGIVWSLSDAAVILVCLPLVVRVCRRLKMGLTAKFVTAYVCALLALLSCVGLEWMRKRMNILGPNGPHQKTSSGPCKQPGSDINYCSLCVPGGNEGGTGIYMSELAAWYYLVPFALTALSEMFALPTTQYFVCAYTPPKMRTMLQALWLIVLNSYSNILMTLCKKLDWAPHDLNEGQIEMYYYFGIGLLLFCLCFVGCRHHNRVVPPVTELSKEPGGRQGASDASGSTAFDGMRLDASGSTVPSSAWRHVENRSLSERLHAPSTGDAAAALDDGASALSQHSFVGALNGVNSFTEDASAGF